MLRSSGRVWKAVGVSTVVAFIPILLFFSSSKTVRNFGSARIADMAPMATILFAALPLAVGVVVFLLRGADRREPLNNWIANQIDRLQTAVVLGLGAVLGVALALGLTLVVVLSLNSMSVVGPLIGVVFLIAAAICVGDADARTSTYLSMPSTLSDPSSRRTGILVALYFFVSTLFLIWATYHGSPVT